jgi:AraC family transcriptional regulator
VSARDITAPAAEHAIVSHDATNETAAPAGQDAGAPPIIGGLPECRLRRVTAYIQSNLHRELRLVELGAVIHMSPYHFARLFKRATGVSPHRFVLQRRIEAATVLLGDSAASIRVVARALGFRTASHFTTTFRRATGVTPTAYRRGRATAERPTETSPAAVAARSEDRSC